MSTSGSINFTMTAREVIVFALRKLRVIGAMETPTADQSEDAMQELNMMLKEWQKYEWLWRITEGSVTLVADTYSYALSPVPGRVLSVRYRNTSGYDLPMTLLTRSEYYDMPDKSTTGIPTQYYVDYQRAAANLLLWQAPSSVTTETLKYTYYRAFEDIDSLDNEIDVRTEHLSTVGYNLAERIAEDYGRSADKLTLRAHELLQQALDDDREEEVRFVPEYRFG